MEEGREAGRSMMKREKSTRFLWNTSTDSKGTTFVILENQASASVRNKRLGPTSKARREASRNEFMEKGGMPNRVKSFQEINSRKYRPRGWPRFVESI